MRGTLKRKTVRTVHGRKVIRLRIDVPYDEVNEEGSEGQDVHEWLDKKVNEKIGFDILPFDDEDQVEIEDALDLSEGSSDGIVGGFNQEDI